MGLLTLIAFCGAAVCRGVLITVIMGLLVRVGCSLLITVELMSPTGHCTNDAIKRGEGRDDEREAEGRE